jgi:hypothetical protein
VVPLVAMLALLPLMIVTSLLFIGIGAMPAIARHVSRAQFLAWSARRAAASWAAWASTCPASWCSRCCGS